MDRSSEAEVRDLHRFFEQWFTGQLPDTDATFARFADALDPDFEIVAPGGSTTGRTALVADLRSAWNTLGSDFRIRIENLRSRWLGQGLWLVRYEEWQHRAGATRGRLSSALLRESTAAPQGFGGSGVSGSGLP